MTQTASLRLSPPLVLATDGSTSAHVAQKLLYPVVQALELHSAIPEQPTLNIVMVQPRSPARQKQKAVVATELEQNCEAVIEGNLDLSNPENLLKQIAAEVPSGLSVSVEVRQGRPATEILNYARSLQAGLIAVGHRGASAGIRDFLLGSVSSAIARYAACSVLIARGQVAEIPTWQHVLLVVDGSPGTQQAIALTRQLIPAGIQ
ncbi:MAG TPA: universal stress protein, partial [Candidatus Caenarcaniphilales bacterium]